MSARVVPFLLLLFFSAAFPSFAAEKLSDAPNESRKVRAVLDAQVAAWNRGDIDGFMNGYARSPDTEFVSGDTVTKGWQTVRDHYRKRYHNRATMGALTFSDVHIMPLGRDAAFAVGHWQLTRAADHPHGRFTLLFRRTTSGWRIVHDHTSSADS